MPPSAETFPSASDNEDSTLPADSEILGSNATGSGEDSSASSLASPALQTARSSFLRLSAGSSIASAMGRISSLPKAALGQIMRKTTSKTALDRASPSAPLHQSSATGDGFMIAGQPGSALQDAGGRSGGAWDDSLAGPYITSPRASHEDLQTLLSASERNPPAWEDSSSSPTLRAAEEAVITSHFSSAAKRYSDIDARAAAQLRGGATIKAHRQTSDNMQALPLSAEDSQEGKEDNSEGELRLPAHADDQVHDIEGLDTLSLLDEASITSPARVSKRRFPKLRKSA